jgi:hypothetical protein
MQRLGPGAFPGPILLSYWLPPSGTKGEERFMVCVHVPIEGELTDASPCIYTERSIHYL